MKYCSNLVKYCSNLERDINFAPDAIQPCCNTRALRLLPRFSFTGGKVDVRGYRDHLMAALAAMQEPDDMCAGCDQLVDVDVPEGKTLGLIPLFGTVSINTHRHLSNCRCVYCNLWEKSSPSYDVLPALTSLAAQRVLRQDCFFSWSGGATIIREFEAASRWIAE